MFDLLFGVVSLIIYLVTFTVLNAVIGNVTETMDLHTFLLFALVIEVCKGNYNAKQ